MATRGGARVLGRGDIGMLSPGMAADLVAFDVNGLEQAGAAQDPVASLVFCTPGRVALSIIAGRIVVEQGRLLTLDELAHAARHRVASRALLD